MVVMRSILFLCSFFGGLYAGAQITLAVTGNNVQLIDSQKRVYRVQAGVPFECVIEISQSRNQNPQITFEGGKGLTRLGVNNTYQNVNGKMSISYGYQFLASAPGEYTLGPLRVTDGQIRYETAPLTIEAVSSSVGGATSGQARGGRKNASQQRMSQPQVPTNIDTTRVEITVNNKEPYINEPVILTINHYFSEGVIDYQTMQPKVDGFALKEIGADSDGRDRSGKRVIQKKYLLSPIATGKKQITPVEVNYLLPRSRGPRQTSGDIFEMFLNDFMDLRPEQKKVESNELEINVKSLPPYKGKVDAVGAFTSFKASVDKTTVPVYETIKYTVRLEGEGNLEQVTAPKLILPASLKTYESKSELIQSLQQGSLEGERKFEFVLQPRTSGDIEIPAQKFTFFNYKKGIYETLSTESVILEVTGNAQLSFPEAPTEEAQKKEDAHKVKEEQKKQEDEALKELVKYSKKASSKLPWYYFIALIILLPLLLFWRNIGDFITFVLRRKEKKLTVSGALARIKKMSERDIVSGALYKVMVEIFVSRYGISDYYASDTLKAKLRADGFSFEDSDRFMHFMDVCASLPFSTTAHEQSASRTLQQEALRWLERLNTKLTASGR